MCIPAAFYTAPAAGTILQEKQLLNTGGRQGKSCPRSAITGCQYLSENLFFMRLQHHCFLHYSKPGCLPSRQNNSSKRHKD
jgi:hypothetical protein